MSDLFRIYFKFLEAAVRKHDLLGEGSDTGTFMELEQKELVPGRKVKIRKPMNFIQQQIFDLIDDGWVQTACTECCK